MSLLADLLARHSHELGGQNYGRLLTTRKLFCKMQEGICIYAICIMLESYNHLSFSWKMFLMLLIMVGITFPTKCVKYYPQWDIPVGTHSSTQHFMVFLRCGNVCFFLLMQKNLKQR